MTMKKKKKNHVFAYRYYYHFVSSRRGMKITIKETYCTDDIVDDLMI
jgi:hypothetical protein